MYSREIDGKTLTLGVSGKLRKNALVMYDRETGTLWYHFNGLAAEGPLKGRQLRQLAATPGIHWQAWRTMYPNSEVLSVEGREDAGGDRYADYHGNPSALGVVPMEPTDTRLPGKEMVLGISFQGIARAYPHARLREKGLVIDQFRTTRVAIRYDARDQGTAVYRLPENVRSLRWERKNDGAVLVGDHGTWSAVTGKPTDSRTRNSLALIPHTNSYWFGWVGYYPKTGVFPVDSTAP